MGGGVSSHSNEVSEAFRMGPEQIYPFVKRVKVLGRWLRGKEHAMLWRT